MQTPLAVYIGRRFSSVRSKNMLIGVISLLSITGLSLGVAILITVLSVMNGFDRELQNRILALVPHITMSSTRNEALQDRAAWAAIENELADVAGVTHSAPFLQLEGMLLANGKSKGIVLNGVDPVAEKNVSIIEGFVTTGDFESLQDRSYQILVGETLATTLGVSIGDKVTLVSTVVPITPFGEFTRQKPFTVGGIFRVGSQLDTGLAIAHIADAQRVYRLGNAVHGLRLQVDDLFNVNDISRRIRTQVTDDFFVSDWTRDYGNIYENIRLSKTLVGFLLTLLVAVAAFNIVVSLVMVVREKQGDIAILRTMGTSFGNIRNIFLVQGFSVGLMGTFFGLLLGILFSLTVSDVIAWLERALDIQFLSADIYPVNYLPAQIQIGDIILVCGLTLFLTMLATLLPAYSAARVDPANALRFE
ncbi:MAG: lipoprotein-releasing ABC transporter permease subunit [Pseudomonadales bacterium]|jgi:lipoprotein-releasing system permease protein